MTARDVIEHIKALPAEEQEKVLEFVTNELALRTLDKGRFGQAAKQVFERHDELMRRLSKSTANLRRSSPLSSSKRSIAFHFGDTAGKTDCDILAPLRAR